MVDLVYGMGITDIIRDSPALFSILAKYLSISFLIQNPLSTALQILLMYVTSIVHIVIGGKREEMNRMS